MIRLVALMAAGGLAIACYQEPEDGAFDHTFDVARSDQNTPVADGVTPLEFTIHLEPGAKTDTPVQVAVSSGVVNFAADPASAEARKLQLTTAGLSALRIPVRAGTTPGTMTAFVTISGSTKYASVELQPSVPSAVTLSASRTDVSADGASQIDLTASLLASPQTAQVSIGARVSFAVCCPSASDPTKPTSCPSSPPLTVVPVAQLSSGNSVLVRAVSTYRTASTPKERVALFVLADASAAPLGCDALPTEPALRAMVPVTMALVAP